MDFGLVKELRSEETSVTVSGEVLGTPEAISPEAIQGKIIGPPADLYAIGCLGCFLLTGRLPYDAHTSAEYYSAHLYQDPISPSARGVEVSPDLQALLLQCLEKDPRDRPRSSFVLRESLLACQDAGLWTESDARIWWGDYRAGVSPPDAESSGSTIAT